MSLTSGAAFRSAAGGSPHGLVAVPRRERTPAPLGVTLIAANAPDHFRADTPTAVSIRQMLGVLRSCRGRI